MKRVLRSLILLPLLLAACESLNLETQNYQLVPPPTDAGKTCAKQCPAYQAQCQRGCDAMKNTCIHNAQLNAQRTFLQYVNDRMAQGLLVDKTEKDFYSEARNCPELQYCRERCEVSLRACHTNCGGQVLHQGNCIANCDAVEPPDTDELYDAIF